MLADALALAVADGVGLELAVESPPPVRTSLIALPMVSSTLPLLADAEGVGVDVPLSADVSDVLDLSDVLDEEADADGVGSALSPEPESDEEVWPEDAEAEGVGSAVSLDLLAEAEGDGVAEALAPSSEPVTAATQSLYSSAVRLFDDPWSSARASVGVNPIPIRTAVGIAAMATAFPAGMWNLVNSGFLGAAWRGPVLTRDSSTSVPWVTSSAGTVPPVRPVRRARS
ncbi:hypothetical protein GCM10011579_058970 [Streptomyces albiflavescens]|uniref:Uncharacterized protein n=1 Tax=Streptomyces albiflavescens TaxID=1623582 RepID=A0A917YA43_9ACTN|nr:hypothetical protein GCM10011579_058970 [Streptomyces albiflavescens]